MTTTEIRPETTPTPAPKTPLKAARPRLADNSFRVITLACGLGVLAILALIALFTTNKALPAFRQEGRTSAVAGAPHSSGRSPPRAAAPEPR